VRQQSIPSTGILELNFTLVIGWMRPKAGFAALQFRSNSPPLNPDFQNLSKMILAIYVVLNIVQTEFQAGPAQKQM